MGPPNSRDTGTVVPGGPEKVPIRFPGAAAELEAHCETDGPTLIPSHSTGGKTCGEVTGGQRSAPPRERPDLLN